MTLNDIKKEVAVLGFENESAIDSSIECAARRALSTIYNEHGVQALGRIYQNSPIPTRHLSMIVHAPGEDEAIPLADCSYAFVISGVGLVEISDENGTRTQEFDTPSSYLFGCIIGEGEIRFKGEFRYTVYDLCIYGEKFADGDEPPRYSRMREYILADHLPDFLCASSCPTDGCGREIAGASIDSGRLIRPYGYVGEISIRYRKRAPEVSIDAPDRELDVPRELEQLVFLLAASYVWLDDDAEKAQYYMSLYRDGMSALKVYTRSGIDTSFTDIARWA